MDAQHVICAGQVRHATRQADATCHKSAEFRHMAGATCHKSAEFRHMAGATYVLRPVLPRSAIIDPVTITANRTGSSRSPSRTVADRIQPTRSKLTVTGKNRSGYGRTVVYTCV